MAKPTQDPKWVTTDDPVNIIEPSAGAKLNGITSGGIWAREHLNWMFNSLSKWVDWIRDNVRSNTENDARFVQHTEVVNNLTSTDTDKPLSAEQGRLIRVKNEAQDTTISALSATNDSQSTLISNRLRKDYNLSDVVDVTTARENLGIYFCSVSISGVASNLPSGWSVVRTGLGRYTVTHNLGTTAYGVSFGQQMDTSSITTEACGYGAKSANTVTVLTRDGNHEKSDSPFDIHITLA